MPDESESPSPDESHSPEQPTNKTWEERHKEIMESYTDDEESFQMPVFRVKAKFFLLPIIVSIIIAGVLAYITYYPGGIQITAAPFSEAQYGEGTGALLNGLFFTLIAGVSSVLIYILVKRRGINSLRIIMTVTFLFLGVVFIIFFGQGILFIFNLPDIASYVLIALGLVLGVLMAYVFYARRFSIGSKNVVVLFFGILIGAFMGIIFPTWTTMTILIGISLWDIISVKRGPIKKIFQLIDPEFQDSAAGTEPAFEPIPKEAFGQAAMEIGIGDIAFYSMLASQSLISTNSIFVWAMTIVGILIGAAWTLRLIRKNKILPGLPLSIFIGIALYWVGVLIISQI
ncbi:MAG TPA: hypothetical protein VKK79_05325 [Candidatus Lokiarchaeia archaeon]|nr:hypothetical protein [Candidatus Lokiarchaeia archaeon]